MGRGGSVGGAAALITVLATASVVFGLGRDVVIAAVFGAGPEMDAFFVAQGLMNVVLGLVAGAMAKAMVPVVARQASVGDSAVAGRTVMVALSVTLVVLGLASVVMWLMAGGVVTVLAPGFDGEQERLARTLTRVVLTATVLVAGTNLLAAAAQAHRRFFWASVQGIPFNLVMIGAAAVFGPRYGVVALAVGFVAGSLARLVCQFVPLRAIGVRLRLSFDLGDVGFREMAVLVPPLLLGSAIGNVNTLVDRAVGSVVGDGTISALSYAWRLVSLGETLLVVSLVTALYPAFGAAAERPEELRRLVGRGLATVAVMLAPVTAVLLVCAAVVVSLVYEHGSFDGADAALTVTAVTWYAPALLALGWREVAVRASYAVGDTRAPVVVAIGAMVVNVAGDLTLGIAFGIPGLAASTTLSLLLAAAANTWLLARRHAAVALRPLAGLLIRTGTAAAAGGAAGAVVVLLGDGRIDGWLGDVAIAAGAGVAVAVVFAGILFAARAPEAAVLREAMRLLLRRA